MATRITDEIGRIHDYIFFVTYEKNMSIKGISHYKACNVLVGLWTINAFTLHTLGVINAWYVLLVFVIALVSIYSLYGTKQRRNIINDIKLNYTNKEHLKYKVISHIIMGISLTGILISLVFKISSRISIQN